VPAEGRGDRSISERPPRRTSNQLAREIEAQRRELTEAVGALRSQVDATRARLMATLPKAAGAVGATIAAVVFFRWRRRHGKHQP
jgi:hypothetical protein